MQYRITHEINTDADTFWERIFFDDAYNQALFRTHLRFNVFRVLSSETAADGTIRRRVENAPPVELPAAAKKVLGDATSYVEEGTFDPVRKRYAVNVVPATAADKIKTHAELWVEPRGDKRCERIVEISNEVKIFGIGKVVEKFIEQQTRKTYDEAAAFTNRWIAEKGL